jgi:hypothetical protein
VTNVIFGACGMPESQRKISLQSAWADSIERLVTSAKTGTISP